MLSVTVNTLKPPFSSTFLNSHPLPLPLNHSPLPKTLLKPISATLTPSGRSQQHNQNQQLYQPFRPPPNSTPLPSQFHSLDTATRLDILANRLGQWFEYAPLIPSLFQQGFTPSSLEEATGISGVEQNRLIVAAQVRDSLAGQSTAIDPELLASFDTGGAELLYQIRLLSGPQRVAAASYIVDNGLDAKGAQDLAKAMKDFPRRRGDKGWESFDYALPGDCLSFMYYRQSREHVNQPEKRTAALELALRVAETEKAKSRVLEEIKGTSEGKGDEGVKNGVKVPVVRLKIGEVAEASSVVVLPVCRGEEREREILEAPRECRSEGEFGVVVAEKGWKRWVVLPAWDPVVGLGNEGGVVVSFADARVLPWKANRWYKEEAILVVADRGRKEVTADDGFYLVAVDNSGDGGGEGLKVERGSALKETGVKECLGAVVLVVRPPREETDNQLSDEDWE